RTPNGEFQPAPGPSGRLKLVFFSNSGAGQRSDRRGITTVDRHGYSGDVVTRRAREPDSRPGDVGRFAPAAMRDPGKDPFVQPRDLLACLVGQLGVEPAGKDRIDLNVVRGPGEGEALGELDDPPLAGRV